MDSEDTAPPVAAKTFRTRYAEAEKYADSVLTALLASKLTLALLVASHGICFAVGMWAAW